MKGKPLTHSPIIPDMSPGYCQMATQKPRGSTGYVLFKSVSSKELWWVQLQLLSSATLPRVTACRSFSFGYVYEYCIHHLANDLIWREKSALFFFCFVLLLLLCFLWYFSSFEKKIKLKTYFGNGSLFQRCSDVVFLKSKYSRTPLRTCCPVY